MGEPCQMPVVRSRSPNSPSEIERNVAVYGVFGTGCLPHSGQSSSVELAVAAGAVASGVVSMVAKANGDASRTASASFFMVFSPL